MNCKICGYIIKPGQQICPNCGMILDNFAQQKSQEKTVMLKNNESAKTQTKPAVERTQEFHAVDIKRSEDPMRYATTVKNTNKNRQPQKKRKGSNQNTKVTVLSVLLVIMVIVSLILTLKVFNIFPFVEETTTTTTTKPTTAPEYESLFEYEINGSNVTITKYIGSNSTVIIPNEIKGKKVTKIGDMAFYQSIIVQTVTFQSSVIEIGEQAFAECSNLTSVNLTENLRVIGKRAFYNCPSLTYIILPSAISNFGEYVFGNCPSLTIICSYSSEAYRYCKQNDYKYKLNVGETETSKNDESTIPPGVENQGDLSKVFITEPYLNGVSIKGATMDITHIDIPTYINGMPVLAISDYAFAKNSAVTTVTIPATVKTIGKYAFSFCPKLTSVKINSSGVVFGKDSFLFSENINLKFTVINGSTAMDYAIINNIPYSFREESPTQQ